MLVRSYQSVGSGMVASWEHTGSTFGWVLAALVDAMWTLGGR